MFQASEALRRQLQEAQAQNSDLQKHQQSLQEALDACSGDLQAAQTAHEAAQEANKQASQAQEGLTSDMARTQGELSARSKELSDAREELDASQRRVDALAEQLKEAQGAAAVAGEGNEALQAELQGERAAREGAEGQARTLEERLKQLQVLSCSHCQMNGCGVLLRRADACNSCGVVVWPLDVSGWQRLKLYRV